MEAFLQAVFAEQFGASSIAVEPIGAGASGDVFKVRIDKPPFLVAVKRSKGNTTLLKKEWQEITYLSNLADIKLPKIYHYAENGGDSYMLMEYIAGKNCADPFVLRAPKKVRLDIAAQIADNICRLQAVKGEKYGDLRNPIYDDWHAYYRPFAESVARAAVQLKEQGLLNQKLLRALQTGVRLYDKIFDEPVSAPTPVHGDYWAQNIMVDSQYKLVGVVDPFSCMWADSEYELFALNAVYGKKLPVLEAFLKKMPVSNKFFLKNSFYLLFSETYWVCKLHHNNMGYLKKINRGFQAYLKQFKLI